MRTSIFAIAACTGLLATAAAAGVPDYGHYVTPASATNQNDQTTKNDPNEVICRAVSHNGTVLSKPVCMTRRGWERTQEQNAHQVLELQMQGDLQVGMPR